MSVLGAAFAAAAQLAEPLLPMAFLMYAYKSRAAAAPEGSGESSSKKKVFCANDIKSIGMSKETTIVFLRGYAENVLSRARQHIAGNAHGAKLMDQDNALAGAFGRLDVGVAECFATNNKKVRTDMLDGIALAWAGEFADEFQNAYGANSLVKSLVGMGIAPQEAKAKKGSTLDSSTAVVLEQFDGDFKSEDTLAALRKEGINVGAYIAPRGQKQPLLKDAMRVVRIDIKNDVVVLENYCKEMIDKDGGFVLRGYVATDKAKLKEFNKKWPANDVATSKESASALLRAIVTVKVAEASHRVRTCLDMTESITLVKRGNVETLKGCAKGTIVLAAGAARVAEESKGSSGGGETGLLYQELVPNIRNVIHY